MKFKATCYPAREVNGNKRSNCELMVADDFDAEGKAKGMVIVIKDFAVVEGKNGLFVSFPSRQITKDGKSEYMDTCKSLSKETREAIVDACLVAFAELG